MRRAAVALSFVAPLIAGVPAIAGDDVPVLSKATLTYDVTSITCTLTTPGGSSNVACNSLLWSVTLQPGWSASISATYDYRYTDDGLALDQPGWLLDSFGGVRPVFVESAGVYVQSLPTCPRGSCPTRPPAMSGDVGLFPVFLSENTIPDDITGSRTLTLTASWSAAEPEGFNWSGQIGFFPIGAGENPAFVNSAAAIPEPSTWALFGVSLLAVVGAARRRACGRAVPGASMS